MGEIAILRAANQADDPQVELALRGIELDAAEARFRAITSLPGRYDEEVEERRFGEAEDAFLNGQKAFREQLEKLTGMDADSIYRRLS